MATILGTNLFGVKAAVDAFLPLIDPAGGRIVQVSSGSAPMFVESEQVPPGLELSLIHI